MWGILSVLCRGGDMGYFVTPTLGVGIFCQSYIGGGDVGYFVSPM